MTQPIIKRFGDIPPEILEWLWSDKIPLGKLTLLVRDPGELPGSAFM